MLKTIEQALISWASEGNMKPSTWQTCRRLTPWHMESHDSLTLPGAAQAEA